jgi:hypothetical protein
MVNAVNNFGPKDIIHFDKVNLALLQKEIEGRPQLN